MGEHPVSGIVFYNPETLEITVQKRDSQTTKWKGEEYSFWGGGIEKDETPEQAMRRELLEELNYEPKGMEYFGQYSYITQTEGKYKGMKIIQHVFLAETTKELLKSSVLSGAGFETMHIDNAIEGKGFVEGSTRFLGDVKRVLEERREGKEGKNSR